MFEQIVTLVMSIYSKGCPRVFLPQCKLARSGIWAEMYLDFGECIFYGYFVVLSVAHL